MQKICKGDFYALFRPKWINYTELNKGTGTKGLNCIAGFLLFSFLLFTNHLATAQSTSSENLGNGLLGVTPLEVGDLIPDELWDMKLKVYNHPQGMETISLRDYADQRLLILDFWATWCGPCIESIDKMAGINKTLSGAFMPILITTEGEKKIQSLFSDRKWPFLSVIEEDRLRSYFPHMMVPHQVWIRSGEVIAITDFGASTEENIRKALQGEQLDLHRKRDLMENVLDLPLANYFDQVENFYQAAFSGHLDGAAAEAGVFKVGRSIKYSQLNRYPVNLYRYLMKVPALQYFILEGVDRAKFSPLGDGTKDNVYCCQFLTDITDSTRLSNLMRKDLDNYFGVSSGYELREVMVRVLVPKAAGTKTAGGKGIKMTNRYFVETLNASRYNFGAPLFFSELDEDIQLPSEWVELYNKEGYGALRRVMSAAGIEVLEKMKNLEMYVIRKSDSDGK